MKRTSDDRRDERRNEMPVKVIELGSKVEEKVVRFTCPECRSVLEATKKDGQFVTDELDGDYIRFVCPVCECLSVNVIASKFR